MTSCSSHRAHFTVGILALAALACGQDHQTVAAPTMVVSTASDADALLPPVAGTTEGVLISDQIFDRLAEPDSTLNITRDSSYRPRLAARWDWSADSLSIVFHIDSRARWHDGARVTASDVRFTLKLYADSATGAPAASLLTNIDSVSVRDSSTAVMWFKHRSPLQFFDATYQMRVLPAHLLDTVPFRSLRTSAFARAPVGSGPYQLRSWQPGVSLELIADTNHYRGRPFFQHVFFVVSRDQNAALLRVLAGEAGFLDFIRATDLPQVASHPNVRTARWPSLEQGALFFNLHDSSAHTKAHPVFGDERVRHAIALAIDRHALVSTVFDSSGHVARGPIPGALLDTTLLADLSADSAGAARLLDAAGWRADKSGMERHRGARPLRFTILVPSTSVARNQMAVLIQAQLKRLGVHVDIERNDLAATMKRASDHKFDAVLMSSPWDPSPSTAEQLWTSASDVPDGSNYSGYRDPHLDAVLDSARLADPARARVLYRRAWKILATNMPAIWLYDLDNLGVIDRSIHPRGIRADAWWGDLSRWSRDSLRNAR